MGEERVTGYNHVGVESIGYYCMREERVTGYNYVRVENIGYYCMREERVTGYNHVREKRSPDYGPEECRPCLVCEANDDACLSKAILVLLTRILTPKSVPTNYRLDY